MSNLIKKVAKKILPQSLKNQIVKALNVKTALTPIAERECNICEYRGFLKDLDTP